METKNSVKTNSRALENKKGVHFLVQEFLSLLLYNQIRMLGVGPKVYFPSFVMAILRPPPAFPRNRSIFKCSPLMNKYDIRNYLESIYGVKVLEVNTIKYLGAKRKDTLGRSIKLADWKKAVVTFDKPFEHPKPFET